MRKILSFIYRNLLKYWPTATVISWLYNLRKYPETNPIITEEKTELARISFVCDEMTWQNFKYECNAVFVTPSNWLKAFQQYHPVLFFCESAWYGILAERDCWRERIYKNNKIRYENRKDLLQILAYCKENKIPTVFWNKEDPVHFDNFIETALLFDYVFTTNIELMPEYKKRGCKNIDILSFGISTHIFYPDEMIKKENTAVFAGSWYSQYPERCRQMIEVFDFILKQGIKLIIYNRNSDTNHTVNRYPEKYKQYIYPRVNYTDLGDIFRRSRYAININTVTDSETMFARRVFEEMACGCIIISNESKGLRNIFGDRIWFYNEFFNHEKVDEIIKENIHEVFEKHTCTNRLQKVFSVVKNND